MTKHLYVYSIYIYIYIYKYIPCSDCIMDKKPGNSQKGSLGLTPPSKAEYRRESTPRVKPSKAEYRRGSVCMIKENFSRLVPLYTGRLCIVSLDSHKK